MLNETEGGKNLMARRKIFQDTVKPSNLVKEDRMLVDGFEIVKGDLIKISGQYGTLFKFNSLVTNTLTGSVWVDCFEMFRNTPHAFRSFRTEDVKRIPQRGKRAKRVV